MVARRIQPMRREISAQYLLSGKLCQIVASDLTDLEP
jgi:hypothetical protein